MAQRTNFITMQEIAQKVVNAGFKNWYVVTVTSMLWVESRGNVWAIGLNAQDPSSAAYLSLDLGLVQWNTYYNPDMTTQQAFDPDWALARMYAKTSGGVRYLDLWSSHKSGAYKTYAHDAYLAARAVGVPI